MQKINKIISKLTLFDKTIIFLVVIFIFSFAYLSFRKVEYLIVKIKVGVENITFTNWDKGSGILNSYGTRLQPGMKEFDGLKRIQAEALAVDAIDTFPNVRDVYLTAKLRVVYNKGSRQYTYKGLPVLIGTTVKLNLDNFLVKGMIVYTNKLEIKGHKQKITVDTAILNNYTSLYETEGITKFLADAIKVGDEFKDSSGNVISKIINKRVENVKKTIQTSDGRILLTNNPLRQDIYITFEVDAVEIGGRYYLIEDIPILIGEGLPFNTSKYSIWPEVTNITLAP